MNVYYESKRSHVEVPMRSLHFFNLPNPSSRTMAQVFTQPLKEQYQKIFFGGVLLTTYLPSVSWLSRHVGSSTSHNPIGLHGLLQGWMYCFFTFNNSGILGVKPGSFLLMRNYGHISSCQSSMQSQAVCIVRDNATDWKAEESGFDSW
jgi:hypothetical protein